MSSETLNTAGAFSQANDLKKRILFTILILIIYRLGTYVPLAGIDPSALKDIMASSQKGLLGMFNMFSGGAVTRMAIFALGIMPYISSSIIVQLLTGVSDYFKSLKEQGEVGRKKITQITRYGTVLIACLQGYGVSVGLENAGNLVIEPGLSFKITTTISLVAGTTFLMWLGEQITLRGVGNGISLIIFSGIVAEIPRALASTFELGRTGALSALMIIGIFVLVILTVLFIVFFERAMRKILINYPKRQVGNKMYGGESSHLPLKINTAGVIPAIFASALLLLPVTISNFGFAESDTFLKVSSMFTQGQPLYMLLYASGIIFFSFFYTSIVFNPKETAENLRKYGGYIPGIRPGERTAEYIDSILIRLTTVGAMYLTFVCLMPEFLIAKYPIPFYLGGTSILIVVVVAMDTVTQVQTRLMSSQYESLIKKTKFGK
jgi:preprotein translocase subunit SecY